MKHPTFLVKLLCLLLILGLFYGYQQVALRRAAAVAEREQEIALAEAHNRAVQQKMNAVSDRFIPGTYEGEAQGFGGVIRVSVTVDENEITGIEVRSSAGEDAAYFSQAETLNAKILQKQSTDLDAVTGATLSSIGLLDAVDAALEQAVQ